MELIIGGKAQGKVNIARMEHPDYYLWDGAEVPVPFMASHGTDAMHYSGQDCSVGDKKDPDMKGIVLDHVHILVRRMLKKGYTQDQILEQLIYLADDLNKHYEANLVLVSDEIGSGIVPMDPFERQWREVTGRVLTAMAARAGRVERVTCGIIQVLK